MKNDRPTDHGKPARRVFIKSFGCQMNVYDSQRMADVAAAEGYEQAASVEDADLIVLNTCHIRERASEKIYSELGKVRQLKDERASAGRETTLVVAGCVAQAEGAEILRRQPRRRHRRRAAELSSPAATAARASAAAPGRSTPSFRSRTSSIIFPRARPRRSGRAESAPSSPCRKAATNSARSASCLTPGAAKSRGPLAKVLAEIERLAAGRRRRNHPARPERQRLSRARRRRAQRQPRRSHRRGGPNSRACCGFAMRLRTRTT